MAMPRRNVLRIGALAALGAAGAGPAWSQGRRVLPSDSTLDASDASALLPAD